MKTVFLAVIALVGMTQADVITQYNFNQDPSSKDPTTQIANTSSTAIGDWNVAVGPLQFEKEGGINYMDTWVVRSTKGNETAWADFTVTVGSGYQMAVTSFEIDLIDGQSISNRLDRRLPETLNISYNTGSGWTALGSEATFPQTDSEGTYTFTPGSAITGLTGDVQFRMTFTADESYTYICHDNVTVNGTISSTASSTVNDMVNDLVDDTNSGTVVPEPKTVGILGLGTLISLLFFRIRS